MKITSKQQMYSLLRSDKLGNHFEWISISDWVQKYLSQTQVYYPKNRYSIRFGKQLNAPWKYNLLKDEVLSILTYEKYLCKYEDMSIVTMPIFITPILTGEISYTPEGLYLYYSFVPDVLRVALYEQGKDNAYGIKSREVLRKYCNPKSYDMLIDVLDKYDTETVYTYKNSCTIEFTVFNKEVGVIPGHNTIIWEVRHY